MKKPKIKITLIDRKGAGEALPHGYACCFSLRGYSAVRGRTSRSGEWNGGVCLPGCGAVQIFDLGNSAHARDAREQERKARTVNGCGLLLSLEGKVS